MRKRRVASTRWAIRICSLELSAPHHRPTARQRLTWSIVSGFKGLENDVVILAGLTDIDDDWYRGVAYVGMSRALHDIARTLKSQDNTRALQDISRTLKSIDSTLKRRD